MSMIPDMMATTAALDPQLRDRVIRLATKALDQAEFIMMHGDPKSKAAITREFLGVFKKHLETQGQNEEIETLKEGLRALTAAVMNRQQVDGKVVDIKMEGDEGVPADTAPGVSTPPSPPIPIRSIGSSRPEQKSRES